MATTIQFQEYGDALRVRATTYESAWRVALSAIACGGFTGIAVHVFAGRSGLLETRWLIWAAIVGAVLAFVKKMFPSRHELRVTNLDYTSLNAGAWGGRQAKSISRMDVRWLEYHDD